MNFRKAFLIFLFNFLNLFSDVSFTSNENELYSYMMQPVICTKSGIKRFITTVYNNDKYKEFLGSCLIHVLDLIESASKTNNPTYFIQQSFNLFIQKIYEVSVINPYALIYFLENSKNSINEIILGERLFIENHIAENLKSMFIEYEGLLRQDKDAFIKNFSESVSKKIETSYLNLIETQNLYLNLVEIFLSKVLFDAGDIQDLCECFTSLTGLIKKLYEMKIINSEEKMHRFLWILSIQFSKSIFLQKPNLNLKKLNDINIWIQSLDNSLFYSEIEPLITSKKQFMLNFI